MTAAVRALREDELNQTLFEALVRARDTFGAGREALVDNDDTSLTYGRFVLGALVLGGKLAKETRHGERVGVLLPNASGAAVAMFGLSAFGRVPAMLNFTAGVSNIRSACTTAEVRTVITSRRFIKLGELEYVIDGLNSKDPKDERYRPVRIIYLEDVRKTIGTLDKLTGLARSKRALGFHRGQRVDPKSAAVILFTSGSEGRPKGVVLSHRNFMANVRQALTFDGGLFHDWDVFINPLPMFHSFGLTGGLLLPLLGGMKCALYPSPLHYKEVPKFISKHKGTLVFSTDTFLRGYARAGAPEDFETLRVVVAGAERVKDDTHATWAKFGTQVIEGYGATECAPIVTVNTTREPKVGAVGYVVPDIEVKLEPIEGMDDAGKLLVRGPNVMLGYMFADNPGVLVPPRDGWHDTGDIVRIADDGVVRVAGRVKRFAKMAGEMVSFAAVEQMLHDLWPENSHVITALPDDKKGEQLILVTDRAGAERSAIVEHVRNHAHSELWIPRRVVVVDEIPLLATGKVNFGTVGDMARAGTAPASAAA